MPRDLLHSCLLVGVSPVPPPGVAVPPVSPPHPAASRALASPPGEPRGWHHALPGPRSFYFSPHFTQAGGTGGIEGPRASFMPPAWVLSRGTGAAARGS